MDVEEIVHQRLLDQLAPIVGDKVYPIASPQDSGYPFITYRRTATEPLLSMSGPSGSEWVELTLDYWTETFAELLGLGRAIVAALDGYRTATAICFCTSQTSEEETGHGQQTYRVFFNP